MKDEFDIDYDSEYDFTDEEIDTSHIENFNNTYSKYKDFYKNANEILHLKIIYLSDSNKILKIVNDDLILSTPNVVTDDELVKILNGYKATIASNLYCMFLYNITIEPEDIDAISKGYYLKDLSSMKNIYLKSSINILQDLNELYIVFKEKDRNAIKTTNNSTKKTRNKNVKNIRMTRKQYSH